ncbi:hypothetical protein SAMN00120144_2346 [Hymenobacter roseosalivarius DSM 11622]|uniref:Thioredoxin domain-containing protein n=1 Tax=Hymenobacter roseosalivarius DSM 11622 TaxID=645990 RepID=A0A1W1VLD3_9BACT|nr:hypothetical protein [Hymenobacter roseosalivarius]SMB94138.1 hypothetical protein SAMN00120144_2346 [Hymenobacter roseosalivarius DSM 11622]
MRIIVFRQVAVVLALLLGTTVSAQQLRFEKDSLGQVLRRAQQLQKPVFLLFSAPAPPPGTPKEDVEKRYGTGLDDAAVAAVLQRDFMLVKAPAFTSAAGQKLARRYYVSGFPTYLYLHSDGTVLHRSFGNTHEAQRYLKDIETFRQKLASPDNLSRLEQRYAQGERSAPFLRQYILARRSIGAPISAALLDAYVQELPVKAFDQFSEVVFVHECGPVVDSRAHKLARLNQRLVDSLYTTLPLARRSGINSLIISNTIQDAIERRDPKLAMLGSNFARGSWNATRNYQMGARVYDQNMMRYYRAVGDTTQYLPMLVRYYEQQYMATPADTVRRRQAAQRTLRGPFQNPPPYPNLAKRDSTAKVTWVESKFKGPDLYAVELNNGAWSLYLTGTRRSSYLVQAMRWSQRTIEVDPQAAYYDTLAHLLYTLRLNTEAEATQQKAIDQAKKEGKPITGFKEELRKIKTRTL